MPRRVLLTLLAVLTALAVFAVMLSDISWWARAVGAAFIGSMGFLEHRQLRCTPHSLQRLPDGIWLAYPKPPYGSRVSEVSGSEINSIKYTLERHFYAGNWSIGMLFRDSRGRKVSVWLLKNTCSDPKWRRLRVLLRWSDAGSGQDAC